MDWFKKQLTDITTWAGLTLLFAVIMPYWFSLVMGVLFLLVSDESTKAWISKAAPWISGKIDELKP